MNSVRGEIALAGRTLRFTTNSLCEFEDAYGKSVAQALVELETKSSIKLLRCLLWAGLLDKEPTATVADAGRLMDEAGFQVAVDAIGTAIRSAFPDADPKQKN